MRHLLFLIFVSYSVGVISQLKNSDKEEIRFEVQEFLETCSLLEYNRPNKFKESYDRKLYNDCTIGEPHFSEVFNKTIFKVESRDSSSFRQDLFYFKESKKTVIYARETEFHFYKNDTLTWKCEYFFKDGKLVDWVSLGHGKTESEDWDIDEIYTKFKDYLDQYGN